MGWRPGRCDRCTQRLSLIHIFSYVRSVNIRRKLPDTIVITVVETDAVAAVKTEDSWWLMNAEDVYKRQGLERGKTVRCVHRGDAGRLSAGVSGRHGTVKAGRMN